VGRYKMEGAVEIDRLNGQEKTPMGFYKAPLTEVQNISVIGTESHRGAQRSSLELCELTRHGSI